MKTKIMKVFWESLTSVSSLLWMLERPEFNLLVIDLKVQFPAP